MSELRNPHFPDPETLRADPRNVIDHFKYWDHDAIVAALDARRNRFAVVLENFAYDFNISTAIRNCNAFLAREVWIAGRRRFDRRGAQGTHRYQHVHHAPDTPTAVAGLRSEGYRVVVIDNVPGATSLMHHRWAPDSVLVFGQEQIGVSPEAFALADDVVYIPQYGSTRSINVGAASAVAMYAYCAQAVGDPPPWDGQPASQ